MKCMNPKTYKKFKRKRVLYIRNILMEDDPYWDAGWKQGFQSGSREEVETFCRKEHIKFRWKGDVLYTEYISPSTVIHPVTGDEFWFNQVYLKNRSSGISGKLSPHFEKAYFSAKDFLNQLRKLDPDDLPVNVLYGDSSFIEIDVIEELQSIYEQKQVSFQWKKGDFILLDNILASHGRNSYQGDGRRVLVTWRYHHII